MKILLSNDDGIYAHGLNAIYKELSKFGEVWVIAPLEEKSTTGHSLTIHKPLRMIEVKPRWIGVSGSPADCIFLGVREIFKKFPDIVVSGINRGANLGQDVYYSGTVSAAREACIMGIPSLAISLAIDFKKRLPESEHHYESAAKIAGQVLKLMNKINLSKHSLLNLNVPDLPYAKIRGMQLANQGFRYYDGNILKRKDHRGKDYYWVGGQYKGFHSGEGTDCDIVDNGFASLTPIKLDCTDHDLLHEWTQLKEFNKQKTLQKTSKKGKSK